MTNTVHSNAALIACCCAIGLLSPLLINEAKAAPGAEVKKPVPQVPENVVKAGDAAPEIPQNQANTPPKPVADSRDTIESQMQVAIDSALAQTPEWANKQIIKVRIIARQDGKFIAVLNGPIGVTDEKKQWEAKTKAEAIADQFTEASVITAKVSLINAKKPSTLEEKKEAEKQGKYKKWLDEEDTEIWPLTYMPSKGSQTTEKKDDATAKATATPVPATTSIVVNANGGVGGAGGAGGDSSSNATANNATPAATPAATPKAETNKPASASSGSKDSAEVLVDTLNDMFTDPVAKKTVVQRREKYLIMRASRRKLQQIKQILLVVDSPWPQVQLDVWAFQASGSPQSVNAKMQEISGRIAIARSAIYKIQGAIHADLQNKSTLFTNPGTIPIKDIEAEKDPLEQTAMKHWNERQNDFMQLMHNLKKGGFPVTPMRPMSLNEMIILFSLADYDTQLGIIRTMQKTAAAQLQSEEWRHNFSAGKSDGEKELASLKEKKYLLNDVPVPLFRHFSQLFLLPEDYDWREQPQPQKSLASRLKADAKVDAVRNGISRFLYARDAAQIIASNPTDDMLVKYHNAPSILHLETATSDRMLYLAMDAFSQDIHEMFLNPLLDKYGESASGVELRGNTRLVVTSGMDASLKPTIDSYIETTNPSPVGADFVTNVLGSAGLASLLPHFTGSQAAALGLVMAQPEPEITKVSPGIELKVRPNVLPDSGGARLEIEARFGVDTTVQERANGKNGVWKSVPAPAVKSHTVSTDVKIDAFDLFDLSSFSIESSHPRSKYLPVIGSIPLLRDLITRPAKSVITHHESLLLVNAVIIPRAVELGRFFVGRRFDDINDSTDDLGKMLAQAADDLEKQDLYSKDSTLMNSPAKE